MVKPSRKVPNASRPPARNKPTHWPPKEPPEGPPPTPHTPPPAFPDPWFPDISVHFYGLNWDLEQLSGGPLEAALGRAFPGASARFAFDAHYAGTSTGVSLSLGFWMSPPLALPGADAARRRGLLELRSPGHRQFEAEALISDAYINNLIQRQIPARLGGNGQPEVNLVGSSIAIAMPATLHVAATYETTVPILGTLHPTCSLNLTFGASGGNLTLAASALDCGDFDLGEALVPLIPTLVFLSPLLLLGGIAVGGYFLANPDSVPQLPRIPAPDLAALLPREIPVDVEMLRLAYARPDFTTRGTAPTLLALHIPVGWNIDLRRPSLSLAGPALADLPLGTDDVPYAAATAEMVNPSFTWTVNGVVQPGAADSAVLLTLDAHTTRLKTRRSFVVAVRAVDGIDPALQATGQMTTVGKVVLDI